MMFRHRMISCSTPSLYRKGQALFVMFRHSMTGGSGPCLDMTVITPHVDRTLLEDLAGKGVDVNTFKLRAMSDIKLLGAHNAMLTGDVG